MLSDIVDDRTAGQRLVRKELLLLFEKDREKDIQVSTKSDNIELYLHPNPLWCTMLTVEIESPLLSICQRQLSCRRLTAVPKHP